MTRRVESLDFVGAVALAERAGPLLAGNAAFEALWPRMTRPVAVESDPPGALVSYAAYGGTPEWRPIGTTPLKDVRIPLGTLRIRAEKEGFTPVEDVLVFGAPPTLVLSRVGEGEAGMVWAAPAQGFSIYVFGLETPRVKFEGFWIDQFEVTNRQYKDFVDAGGYRRPEFWKQPVMKDGKAIPFADAMGMFKDATGRPGPSTWSQGSFAPGQEEMPVSGVSWYEASAYAAFTGTIAAHRVSLVLGGEPGSHDATWCPWARSTSSLL